MKKILLTAICIVLIMPASAQSRPGRNAGNNRPVVTAPPTRPGTTAYNPTRPGTTMNRPYRPGAAPTRPGIRRPTPPANYRPSVTINLWNNIFGVRYGTSMRSALSHLRTSGYRIDGYSDNEIYLTNVSQYGYLWHEATMYYSSGAFCGISLYYSTIGYDLMRYRQVATYLTKHYGNPVITNNSAEGMSTTWYGNGTQYITLDFGPLMTDAGRRYFTTLTIGN